VGNGASSSQDLGLPLHICMEQSYGWQMRSLVSCESAEWGSKPTIILAPGFSAAKAADECLSGNVSITLVDIVAL
jgi:hypothetical protein